MKNIFQLALIFTFTIGLFSCATPPRVLCNILDPDCRYSGAVVAQKSTMQASIIGKSADYLSLNFNSSNVIIWSSNPSVNIILKDNGSIIDTLNAPLNFNNYIFTFSNPESVNNFILFNDGVYDEISYNFNGIKYVKKPGSNNIVGEIKYENTTLTGSSWSYYENPNQGCSGYSCQQF